MKKYDLTGQKFGRLTVIKKIGKDKRKNVQWLCKCDCGNEKITSTYLLNNGRIKSCSCLWKETLTKLRIANTKHFGCLYCGSDKHYAKGCCKNCYNKLRRGTLE